MYGDHGCIENALYRNYFGLGIGARFEVGKHQQIRRNTVEPHGISPNNFNEFAVIGVVIKRSVEQRFRIADDSGERRPQFVRNVGNEVLPNLFESFKIGNIVQNRNRAAAGRHR